MTSKTPDGAVAWQWRLVGEDDSLWTPCRKDQAERVANDPEWETRALIPAASLDALRADIAALRSAGLYTANRLVEAETKLAAVGALADRLEIDGLDLDSVADCASDRATAACLDNVARRIKSLIAEAGTGEGGSNG